MYYFFYYEGLGEIAIPEKTIKEGLTIYAPELQDYSDAQLKDFGNSYGDGYFNDNPYTRQKGLEFLAWHIDGDVTEGIATLSEQV